MIEIPQSVKNALINGNCTKNFRFTFPNDNIPDITNENLISESVTFTESLCSQDSLRFGLQEKNVITFRTFGIGSLKGKLVSCDLEVEVEGTTYKIPYGRFVIETSERDARNTQLRKHTGYSADILNKDRWRDTAVYKALKNNIWYADTPFLIPYEYLEFVLNEQSVDIGVNPQSVYDPETNAIHINSNGYNIRIRTIEDITISSANRYGVYIGKRWIYHGATLYKLVNRKEHCEVANSMIGDYNTYVEGVLRNYGVEENAITQVKAELLNRINSRKTIDIDGSKNIGNYLFRKSPDNGSPDTTYVVDSYDEEPSMTGERTVIEELDDNVHILLGHAETYGVSYSNSVRQYYKKDVREAVSIPTQIEIRVTQNGTTKFNDIINFMNYSPLEVYMNHVDYVYTPDGTGYVWLKTVGTSTTMNDLSNTAPILSIPRSETITSKTIRVDSNGNRTQSTRSSRIGTIDIEYEDLIGAISELQGAFGVQNRATGLFEYKLLSQDAVSISKNQYETAWYDDEETKQYSGIVCNYTDTTGASQTATYQIVDLTETDNDGELVNNPDKYQVYDLSDNMIIKNFRFTAVQINYLLERMATNIADVVYRPADIDCIGLPHVECGDRLSIETDEGMVNTYALRRTISGIQALMDNIESRG